MYWGRWGRSDGYNPWKGRQVTHELKWVVPVYRTYSFFSRYNANFIAWKIKNMSVSSGIFFFFLDFSKAWLLNPSIIAKTEHKRPVLQSRSGRGNWSSQSRELTTTMQTKDLYSSIRLLSLKDQPGWSLKPSEAATSNDRRFLPYEGRFQWMLPWQVFVRTAQSKSFWWL